MIEYTDEDVRLARGWAELYAARGIPVLPSRTDKKAPCCKFRHYADDGEFPPLSLFDEHRTPNLQAVLGSGYGVIVVDLDGPEAPAVWESWGQHQRTWTTHSGGDGLHLWFRVPDWRRERPVRPAVLWKGRGDHSQIDLLGDGKLAMAPPSLHPGTGRRYRFLAGLSPMDVPVPAFAPAWLFKRRAVGQPDRKPRPGPGWLAAIPNKVERARGWGVEFTGRRGPSGWWECRAVGRRDRKPSAAVHEESGYYVDLGSGERMSFVQLAVALGAFASEEEALDALREEAAA